MKMLLASGLLLAVSACSATQQASVAARASSAADTSLKAAEWAVCVAPSVGAVTRRFGGSRKLRDWQEFCGYEF